jgi:glutaredoxin 3
MQLLPAALLCALLIMISAHFTEAASAGNGDAGSIVSEMTSTPLAVFSKSYCGYSARAKSLFASLGADAKILEIDQHPMGAEIQSYLASVTGQRTVPNVWIGGKFIGGSDKVHAMHQSGELIPLLKKAGVQFAQDL